MVVRGKGNGGKRKNSVSPNSKNVKKSKQAKVINKPQATNSQVSSIAPSTSQSPSVSSQSRPIPPQSTHVAASQDPVIGKTVKPVFIKAGIEAIQNVIQSIRFATKPLLKIRGSSSTQVLCFSIDDKKILINKLRSEKIGFHSFTDAADKPAYFLLKGFYHKPCPVVLSMLQESNVPAVKVTDFIRNDDNVIYIVHVDKSVNLNTLNHSHKYVANVVVKWDVLRKTNKKVTQCYRCQSWGHSANNCGYIPRCVKCSESHELGSCSRTSRIGDPTCCNCGGPHASNHRGCPVYKEHLEKVKARTKKPPAVIQHRVPVPLSSTSHFPRLGTQISAAPSISIASSSSPSVSFAQVLSESNSHSSDIFTKLNQAQAKLNSLPNFNETIDVFVRMVDELSACSDQKGQLLILLKYTSTFSFANNGS